MSAPASRRSKAPAVPRPSASIILLSPTNEILLLHRVQSSSAFPSAHVFPGGNLSPEQDGLVPDIFDAKRHQDCAAYRIGAIRECFEESGIILAKKSVGSDGLLEVGKSERESARRRIHNNEIRFLDWIEQKHGALDVEALIPFTRWITPTNIPKRFTTQMYIYFLPLCSGPASQGISADTENIVPIPTTDGGIEHTAARFDSMLNWLRLARSGDIVLYPPQFFLIHLLEQVIAEKAAASSDSLQDQRDRILNFVRSGAPPWTEKVISPIQLIRLSDGRTVMALDKPGEELQGSGRCGEAEKVVLVDFQKGVPRRLQVAEKKDILDKQRL